MKDKKQKYLEEQLATYEQETRMTASERYALHKWVRSGHSVYESPGSRYLCDYGLPEQDFLDVYRQDCEISRHLEGKTDREQLEWMKSNLGYREPAERIEPTIPQMKEHIQKLERELFHLWEYVSQEGMWSEAKEYVDENADEPIPFEYT